MTAMATTQKMSLWLCNGCEKYFSIQGMASPWDRTWPGALAPGMALSRPGLMKWSTLNLEPGQRKEGLLDIILR